MHAFFFLSASSFSPLTPTGNDIKEFTEPAAGGGGFLPTKSPKIHFPDSGFRPTVDGKPQKSQEKPHKKYQVKEDPNKAGGGNTVFTSEGDKYEFTNYETVRPQAGPGFFNPDASKNQYEFNSYQRPGQQPQDQIPPELYHVFGQTPQQGPFRIEHLLQQIQGADPNQGPLQQGQNPHVFLHPGQFGQVPPHQLPGANVPGSGS